MKNINYSDFWAGINDDLIDINDNKRHLIVLASIRRAISNFVSIVAGKFIPVQYNSKDINMTDGKVIYLSSDIKSKDDFDFAVGLALHEASHILLTDFIMISKYWMDVPREIYDVAKIKGISKESIIKIRKDMWNYIEDRFIDDFIYNTHIGYRGYYIKLYDKAFNDPNIDIMLKSNMYRIPNFNSYIYRIINFTNINTDLSALPDLELIYNLIDIDNIRRLTNSKDRWDVADNITNIIIKNVFGSTSDSDIDNSNDSDNFSILGGNKINAESITSTNHDRIINNEIDNDGNVFDLNALTDLKSKLKYQQDFLDGNVSKKALKSGDRKFLNSIDRNGIDICNVGKDYDNAQLDCIFVKKLTKDLILDDEFPLYNRFTTKNSPTYMQDIISSGIRMGNILAKRLRFRDELNIFKSSRKSNGKLDRRILHELASDNFDLFYKFNSQGYDKLSLHISVDASSSMLGEKWEKTMIAVTAICKAASSVQNIDVVISLRTSIFIDNGAVNGKVSNSSLPYLIIAYDSKVDKFSKIKNLFPFLSPNGGTPEGLAFEALFDTFQIDSGKKNLYFINFSDGEPCLEYKNSTASITYTDFPAAIHTHKQINKLRSKGYKIMSYFIENKPSSDNSVLRKLFKIMYNDDGKFINVTDILIISKSMVELFLNKSNNF